MHNPTFRAPGGSASNPPTPHLGPLPHSASTTALAATAAPSSSISAFMLDSRAPPSEPKISYFEQEAAVERHMEEEARRLMAETRLWRLANSAQWVAWGIIQAQVPGIPNFDDVSENKEQVIIEPETSAGRIGQEGNTDPNHNGQSAKKTSGNEQANQESQTEEEEEFDYLGYASERALFFLGDAVTLGMVTKDELPQDLWNRLKVVEY